MIETDISLKPSTIGVQFGVRIFFSEGEIATDKSCDFDC